MTSTRKRAQTNDVGSQLMLKLNLYNAKTYCRGIKREIGSAQLRIDLINHELKQMQDLINGSDTNTWQNPAKLISRQTTLFNEKVMYHEKLKTLSAQYEDGRKSLNRMKSIAKL